MSMNNQEEYSFSKLGFFKRPTLQSDILNGKLEKIYPIAKLQDSKPIKFLIENVMDYFLGLRQSYLNIKFRVGNSNGSNLAADAKVGLVNYAIASLFQQVNVFFNGNLTSRSTNTFAYRAMLEVLLGDDRGAKNSYLSMGCYGKDTGHNNEN